MRTRVIALTFILLALTGISLAGDRPDGLRTAGRFLASLVNQDYNEIYYMVDPAYRNLQVLCRLRCFVKSFGSRPEIKIGHLSKTDRVKNLIFFGSPDVRSLKKQANIYKATVKGQGSFGWYQLKTKLKVYVAVDKNTDYIVGLYAEPIGRKSQHYGERAEKCLTDCVARYKPTPRKKKTVSPEKLWGGGYGY